MERQVDSLSLEQGMNLCCGKQGTASPCAYRRSAIRGGAATRKDDPAHISRACAPIA